MRMLTLIVLIIIGCSSKTNVTAFSSWDTDGSKHIDRAEFVNTYPSSNWADQWSNGNYTMSYTELYNGLFAFLDTDDDDKVSIVEFNSRIQPFYFGMFNGNFANWDNDANASIDKTEFVKNVSDTNLASYWDTESDNTITKRELAGGMFYLCDEDSNGKIERLEFDEWKRNRNKKNNR